MSTLLEERDLRFGAIFASDDDAGADVGGGDSEDAFEDDDVEDEEFPGDGLGIATDESEE